MVGKAKGLGERAVLTKINGSGIRRQWSSIEEKCNQPAIVCVPTAGCQIDLSESRLLFPWRKIESVIDEDLEPKNPAASRGR
jgi:hypothetical protein